MMADIYNSDERAKTFAGLIESFAILAKYAKDGMDERYPIDAQHDEIYSCVNTDALPRDSDDGRALIALGWHVDEEDWSYFT